MTGRRATTGQVIGRRVFGGLVMVVALVCGALVGPTPEPETTAWQSVSSTQLVCPELAVPDGSASVATGLVADPASGSPEQRGAARSTASLRVLDTGQDLARIPEVDDPVNLLVATRSTGPIVLTATGAWAGSALAGVATRELAGEAAGLSSSACAPPRAEWWFVGAGSRLGRRAALLVSNASAEPASFDISLHAQSGPVEALAGKGITLGPQSRVRLRLDALAEGQDLLAVHVHATSGRVSAALRDVASPVGERPRGVDYLPPATEPAPLLWIPGVPAGTRHKDLVLVNPGNRFASVTVRLIASSGTSAPPALASLAVPAGSSISYSLDDALGQSSGTLELRSDAPVTAAVRSVWGRPARQDLMWLAATPPLVAPNTIAGAAQVPSGPGLTTTVTIAAPEGDVRGTLEVLATGDPATAVLGPDGPLEDGELARRREQAGPDGPVVLTEPTTRLPDQDIVVQAGTQTTVELPATEGGQLHLLWRAAPESGPASLAHRSVDADRILATGYPWWPTISEVPVASVRDDVGTLAPLD